MTDSSPDNTLPDPLTRENANEAALGENDRTVPGPDPVMVILRFQTDRADELTAILARYVILSRHQPGCRNIDLVASATRPGAFVVVEKWHSIDTQRAHFDSDEMVTMAQACAGLLTAAPDIDLFEGVSMHDLA